MTQWHLCVITGQPLANLIPILSEKPDYLCLVHTADMASAAQAFAQTLKQAGFSESQLLMKGALPKSDYEQIQLYIMDLRDQLASQYPEMQLTWNATGGTKIMALAIADALDPQDRVIYCDTQEEAVQQLRPTPARTALPSVLTPELYLAALGKIKRRSESDSDAWQTSVNARKELTRYLAENASDLQGLIQQFNRHLSSDKQQSRSLTLGPLHGKWQKAIELLQQFELLDSLEANTYVMQRKDSARYLTGGWLEEYVWLCAKQQGIEHIELGLKCGDLANRKQGQDNEIDGFLLHHNRLLLVECKSGYMGKDTDKDSAIIYKLDSLAQHVGGVQATKLLVSAQPLQHETKAGKKVDTKARASGADILTLEALELKNLKKYLLNWKDSGKWQN